MYNLLEYSKNYSKTSGSLWNFYRYEPNKPQPVVPAIYTPAFDYNKDPITNFASLKYKNSFTGKAPNNDDNDNNVIKSVKIIVPLKHLGNFWRTLDMLLINCEVSLTLTWPKNYVLGDIIITVAVPTQRDNPARPAIDAPTGATFKIEDTKLYVAVVTLSAENDNKLLEQLKTGFKRTITWNKHRSEMSNQNKNNSLNHLIDPTFTNVNRLFVLSFKNESENENDVRTSFKKYYVPKVEVKDFIVLIDEKPFLDIPIKK